MHRCVCVANTSCLICVLPIQPTNCPTVPLPMAAVSMCVYRCVHLFVCVLVCVHVGVLVAVGVVDVLPSCLSSVYLFWDPDLRHLGLGKLSALYELLWVHQVGITHTHTHTHTLCPPIRICTHARPSACSMEGTAAYW